MAAAGELLSLGIDYAGVKNSDYTKILFLLAKGMVMIVMFDNIA